MNVYSTYCKEIDPFSKDFDPEKALRELDVPGPSSTSVDCFEQELMESEETKVLVNKLIEIETAKTTKERPAQLKPLVGDRARRLIIKKRVLQTKYDEAFKRTGIEYFDGVGFALAHDGPFECLRNWVKNQTRITIKVRSYSPTMQPNRYIQAIIVAYDKHWNLLIRDCDEVYLPPKRVGYVQTQEQVMPNGGQYTRLEGTNILTRYSKCTIVMGKTIVCIYDEQSSE